MQIPAPYMGDPFLSANAGKIWMIDFKKLSHEKLFFYAQSELLARNQKNLTQLKLSCSFDCSF